MSRWVLCEIRERLIENEEPDWSRVPEQKRETVQARWLAANAVEVVSQVQLWQDQIPFFARQYDVTLLEDLVVTAGQIGILVTPGR